MAKDGDDRGERETVAPSESDIEKYRLFAEATEEGIVIHDFKRILAVNSHWSRMFGYAENRVEGTDPFKPSSLRTSRSRSRKSARQER